jgi:rhodanese-related sulfurtransferase
VTFRKKTGIRSAGAGKRRLIVSDGEYAGDLTPPEAWDMLAKDQRAVLVDVRTQAEWAYVGVADLSNLGKAPMFVSWQVFPDMRINGDFCHQVAADGIDADTPLLFFCRSGVRSRSAAAAMTGQGFSRCYNVSTGFEGDCDGTRHRGTVSGWKVDGLPWVQR